MSGVKRKIEDKDPDYEDIAQVLENKRSKVVEQNGTISSPCMNYPMATLLFKSDLGSCLGCVFCASP